MVSVGEGTYAEDWAKKNSIQHNIRKAPADVPIASGTCGDNATWALYVNGTLKIGGSGAMTNYADYYDAPWTDYRNKITTIEIGPEITAIGDRSFYGSSLTNVIFAENGKLTRIGQYAFYYQSKLAEIHLPESIEEIDFCAFARCTGLTSVYIPNGAKQISNGAFAKCDLTKLVVSVGEGTYAQSWAKKNDVTYTIH